MVYIKAPNLTWLLTTGMVHQSLVEYYIYFLMKGHKLIRLLANMKSSYRIHEHNSDNYDKLILTN